MSKFEKKIDPKTGDTPLHIACRGNDPQLIYDTIKEGYATMDKNHRGATAHDILYSNTKLEDRMPYCLLCEGSLQDGRGSDDGRCWNCKGVATCQGCGCALNDKNDTGYCRECD